MSPNSDSGRALRRRQPSGGDSPNEFNRLTIVASATLTKVPMITGRFTQNQPETPASP